MSRINRVPFGLLDFLATKTQGDNPSQLLQEVRPTLDLTKFFIAERMENFSEVQVSAAAAGGFTFTVPVGEIWFPVTASMTMIVADANGRADLQVKGSGPIGGIGSGTGQSVIFQDRYFTQEFAASTVGQQLSVNFNWPMVTGYGGDFVFLGSWLEGTHAVNTTFVFTLNFYRYTS